MHGEPLRDWQALCRAEKKSRGGKPLKIADKIPLFYLHMYLLECTTVPLRGQSVQRIRKNIIFNPIILLGANLFSSLSFE